MLAPGKEHRLEALASSGSHHDHFFVSESGQRKFFVKMARTEENASSLKREFDALVLVRRMHRDNSLLRNLPNPLYFSRVEGNWALVLGALDGTADPAAFYQGGFSIMKRIRGVAFLKVLPEVLVNLHQPLRLNARPPEILAPPGLSDKAQALLEGALAQNDRNPGPVGGTHGDFGPSNILKTAQMAWFVDWEDYQKQGLQVHDLFSLYTFAALGADIPLVENSIAEENPKNSLSQVAADSIYLWLFRRCSFQRLFFGGIREYAQKTGFDYAWLAASYPTWLASRYWQELVKWGPFSPRTQVWVKALDRLAAAPVSPLNAAAMR